MKRNINVQLSFAYEPRALRPWLAVVLLLLAAGDLASENVTLTTYYPAPSGVYTQMVTTGQTLLARDNTPTSKVGIGMGAAGVPAARLDVTGYPSASITEPAAHILSAASRHGLYLDVGSNSTSLTYGLIVGPANLVVRDDGRVGIGTSLPAAKLAVEGQMYVSQNISVGPQPMATTAMTNPYVYVNTNAGFCNDQTTNNLTCVAGRYITWTPGIYTASDTYYSITDGRGWWSSGPNVTNVTVNTNIGPQYSIITTAPRYFCCRK
ncbi:MAG: hypothetical protein A2X40_06830 [Elusimicrobia bacterium GWC2_65_9]|nr:MAG: hypothetical protein A2X37_06845 [Elusimicrobia bacterium GWA2_66_18]OGR73499.1 MAG: hypothetical protein A2X40_06830 [Elusimicrobia bacterium GWC2_65_9]